MQGFEENRIKIPPRVSRSKNLLADITWLWLRLGVVDGHQLDPQPFRKSPPQPSASVVHHALLGGEDALPNCGAPPLWEREVAGVDSGGGGLHAAHSWKLWAEGWGGWGRSSRTIGRGRPGG